MNLSNADECKRITDEILHNKANNYWNSIKDSLFKQIEESAKNGSYGVEYKDDEFIYDRNLKNRLIKELTSKGFDIKVYGDHIIIFWSKFKHNIEGSVINDVHKKFYFSSDNDMKILTEFDLYNFNLSFINKNEDVKITINRKQFEKLKVLIK